MERGTETGWTYDLETKADWFLVKKNVTSNPATVKSRMLGEFSMQRTLALPEKFPWKFSTELPTKEDLDTLHDDPKMEKMSSYDKVDWLAIHRHVLVRAQALRNLLQEYLAKRMAPSKTTLRSALSPDDVEALGRAEERGGGRMTTPTRL